MARQKHGAEMKGNVHGSKFKARGAKGLSPQLELLKHGGMSGTDHKRSTRKRGGA